MEKKFLLIIFVLIFCSGCRVEYDINIVSLDKMVEKVNFYADSSLDSKKIKEFDQFTPVDYRVDDYGAFEKKLDGIEYYRFSKRKDNSNMCFSYTYDIDDIQYDMLNRKCFEYVTFIKNSVGNKRDAELVLSTIRKFLCFNQYDNLDNVTVNVYSKYKLKETNADEVFHHKYIWHFDRSNSNNKFIYLLLDTTKRDLNFWERLLEGNSFTIFAIAVVIFIFSLFIFMLLRKKGQMRNKV